MNSRVQVFSKMFYNRRPSYIRENPHPQRRPKFVRNVDAPVIICKHEVPECGHDNLTKEVMQYVAEKKFQQQQFARKSVDLSKVLKKRESYRY